jgi:hypothetical protein
MGHDQLNGTTGAKRREWREGGDEPWRTDPGDNGVDDLGKTGTVFDLFVFRLVLGRPPRWLWRRSLTALLTAESWIYRNY